MKTEKKEKTDFQLFTMAMIWFSIICIVIKLLNIVIFPLPNILLFFLLPLLLITLVIYGIVFRRQFKSKKMWAPILLCFLAVATGLLLSQKPLDLTKYYLQKSAYNTAAKQIVAEVANKEDTLYEKYEPKGLSAGLIRGGAITYRKVGENIIVDFTASASFSFQSGFTYFSGPNAYDFLDHPEKYAEGLTETKRYEARQVLHYPQWSYVEWFW